MELYGELGTLYMPDPNFFAGELKLTSGADFVELPEWEHPYSVPNFHDNDGRHLANYRCSGLSDMAVSIQQGKPHRCSLEFAHHVVDVMTSILNSGESGQKIKMTTTCERPEPLDTASAQALLT